MTLNYLIMIYHRAVKQWEPCTAIFIHNIPTLRALTRAMYLSIVLPDISMCCVYLFGQKQIRYHGNDTAITAHDQGFT